MNEALTRYVEAATGITQITRNRAERLVKTLIEQGELAARNPQELVANLLERSQDNREALVALVRSETRRAVRAMGLATREEMERLERRLQRLEGGAGEAARKSTAKTAPKKTAGKKATTRGGTAKKAAKKTAAQKTSKKTSKKTTGGEG